MTENLIDLHEGVVKMNEIPGRCQCLPPTNPCPNLAIQGEAFCRSHLRSCPRKANLSGSEPEYNPDMWNKKKQIRLTHNCFSYAFNIFDKKQMEECFKSKTCHTAFHQPGKAYKKFNDADPKTCPNMIARIMGDNPNDLITSDFDKVCPDGMSKIALIVDESDDYHFLRQDSNGYFSQKGGSQPVTDKDALKHRIFDVELAYHNYRNKDGGFLNYDRSCGYFCLTRNKPLFVRVGGKRQTKRNNQKLKPAIS